MRFVRRRGMVAHSLCFAVVLAWTNAGRAEEPAGRALTGAELEALERGELVTRALRQQRGNQLWFGGSSWQVIDAPPSTVWQALHDTARYPQMLPRVSQAQLVAGGGFDRVVCIEQRAWPIVASYCVHLRSDARAAELDFEL
ncbi:MAG TPA: SRPBCC family protein, partial [Polyangiales bacterium]|nr:SRPBCC family protein [Polyangiales bacterium]